MGVTERINNLVLSITEQCSTKEAQAKEAICIFLLGCYCTNHKQFLTNAKNEILKLKVPCVLLEDLMINGIDDKQDPDYALKFKLCCEQMLSSIRLPIPFIYASGSDNQCGIGLSTELVTLCENQAYEGLKSNIKLFMEPNIRLPHQERSIIARISVLDGNDFVKKAVQVCNIEVNRMMAILSKDNSGGK